MNPKNERFDAANERVLGSKRGKRHINAGGGPATSVFDPLI